MDELQSMWNYQESIDELKQKLLYTAVELDSVKVQANEEMIKHKIYVQQLIELLKIVHRERDEAKFLLQKLLHKFFPATPIELQQPVFVEPQPRSPLVIPVKANSSMTESSSQSDTYNHFSHGSSPVDPFLDGVSSPDFSCINMADSGQMGFVNEPFVQECNVFKSACLVSPLAARVDPADAVIDNLLKGKVLPHKGKLLSAVMEAGPLLQTLLVAGSLPRWRNPPPLQPLKIPPVSIKGCDVTVLTQKPSPSVTPSAVSQSEKLLTTQSHVEISRSSSQFCSASLLNSHRFDSASGPATSFPINSGVNSQVPAGSKPRAWTIHHSFLPIYQFAMKVPDEEGQPRPSSNKCAICLRV